MKIMKKKKEALASRSFLSHVADVCRVTISQYRRFMTSGSVAGERAKREIHSTAKILRMFNVNSAECPSKRNGNEIMGKASHFSVGRCRSRCESFVALR